MAFRVRLVRVGCAVGLLSVFLVVGCLSASGLAGAVPRAGGAAVLLLHEVDPEPAGNPAVISPRELAGLLDLLGAAGYVLVSPAEFLAYLEGRRALPERAVVLSFDDGYAGVYLHGYPVLQERGLAAFLFPVAKWYSPHPRPERARPHLTAAQTRELLAAGWVVGGHTYDGHRLCGDRSWAAWPLPGEDLGEYRARVWADIQLMKLELGRLGMDVVDFAPPYGQLSPEFEDLLREAGVRRLWVQEERLNFSEETRVARLAVSSVEDALARLARLFGPPRVPARGCSREW